MDAATDAEDISGSLADPRRFAVGYDRPRPPVALRDGDRDPSKSLRQLRPDPGESTEPNDPWILSNRWHFGESLASVRRRRAEGAEQA